MKTWIVILLSILALTVAGCSSSDNPAPGAAGDNQNPPVTGQTPTDTDGDGVADALDAFPNDPLETADSDQDGIGNNADLDDDNDGVADAADAFPVDPAHFAAFASTPTTLEPLSGGTRATAVAVNEAGLIAGHSEPAPNAQLNAVFWSFSGGPATALAALAGAPAGGFSAAYGVNEAGAVVGEAEDGNGNFTAVFWPSTTGSPAALARLGAGNTFSAAFAVNAGGMIVGEAENNAFDSHAVVWTSAAANPIDLGTLPGGLTSTAYAVNDAGIIAGESDDGARKRHAVVWQPNGNGYAIVDLGIVGEAGSTASGISSAGVIVGETETAPGQIQAAAWVPGPTAGVYTRRDLSALGMETTANGITGNRIMGYKRNGTINEATVWDLSSTAADLSEPVTGMAPDSQAYAATTAGRIVGRAGAAGFLTGP